MVEIRAGTGGDEAKYFCRGFVPYVQILRKSRLENFCVVDMNEGLQVDLKRLFLK
jgi:protein subunit release factor A